MNRDDHPPMRLGIGSYTYAWAVGIPGYIPGRPLTALGLLEKAAELKVGLVQICDNLPLHTMQSGQLAELRAAAIEKKTAIEVGTRGIAPAHLRRYIQLAVDFQSPLLRVVMDTAKHHPTVDEVVDLLGPLRHELEQAGVYLAVENHDRFTAGQFRDIMTRLESPHVGMCLDTVNSFGVLEGPEVVVNTLAPWVINLHVKDFVIRRMDHQLGFVIEGCPAGQGRLNLPWLLQQLHVAPRTPNAILEQWSPPEPTLEATIAKENRWACASLDYLRSLIAH